MVLSTVTSLLTNQGFLLEEAEVFLKMLSTGSSKEAQLAASFYFRKKLSNCQEPPKEVVRPLIAELLKCLNSAYPEVQLNVTWTLTNLACGTREDTHAIVDAGGVGALYQKVRDSPFGEVRDQAMWALGNIAADCRNCREQVRHSRLLPLLIDFLEAPEYQPLAVRKNVIWCIVNILRGGMSQLTQRKAATLFCQLYQTACMTMESEDNLSDAVWSIAYLLDHADIHVLRIDYVLDHPDIVPFIIGLLDHSSPRIVQGSLRAVGNIVTGHDDQATAILEVGLLEKLIPLIDSSNEQVARETLWVLSNIAAGTEEHISQLLSVRGLPEKLFEVCASANHKKKREAQWTLVNSTMGASDEGYFFLLSGGVAHELVRILDEIPSDKSLVERALQTIMSTLRDRQEKIIYTRTVYKQVGLVTKLHERAFFAYVSNDSDFRWRLAASILREFFDVDATQPVQEAPEMISLTIQLKRRKDG